MPPYWVIALAVVVLGAVAKVLAAIAWYAFNALMAKWFGPEVLDRTRHLRAEPISETLPKALAQRKRAKSKDGPGQRPAA